MTFTSNRSDNVVPCGPIAPLARTVSVDDDFTSPQRFADILETEEPGNTSSISKDFPNLDETQDDPFEKPRHTLILSPSWIPATPDIPISSPKSPPCSPVSRLLESSSSVETPSPMRIASPLNLKKKKISISKCSPRDISLPGREENTVPNSLFSLEDCQKLITTHQFSIQCKHCKESVPLSRLLPEQFAPSSLDFFEIDQTRIEKKLGEGGHADIFLTEGKGGDPLVLKMLKPDSPLSYGDFRREVWMMSSFSHPNLVSCIGWCPSPPGMLMEFMDLGDLRSYLIHNELRFSNQVRIATEIANGMNYLHNQIPAIIHLDLKSLNVLLKKSAGPGGIGGESDEQQDYIVAKLSDFGTSHYLSISQQIKTKEENEGNCAWTAPEILSTRLASKKSDVYSFALVLWEIFSRQIPFAEYQVSKHLSCNIYFLFVFSFYEK